MKCPLVSLSGYNGWTVRDTKRATDLGEIYSFGEWIKQRRKVQHLTQTELAMKAACAVATIKKIEADERRPSVDIAEMLADALAVPRTWRERFVACARGQRPVDTLEGMGAAEQAKSPSALPMPPTPFIGRDMELTEVSRLLNRQDCRLLTLVGPGGIGKTRLAVETAYRLYDVIQDGAVFVPLMTITEIAAIPAAIIHSLNLAVTNEEQLFSLLRPLQMLLVLDNCEQLGEHSAWFSTLLREVPGVKLLATSRERLQLRDEWVFTVPEMASDQATRLLRKSGERGTPELQVTDEDAESVCTVVENLPLAIELAAGWLRFMTCEQIVQSIQRDVDFLATNMRDVPERHRSIRAVFDYSWKMLSEQEQNALMRLSVFRGGWRVAQAEQVAGANIRLLRSLVDKSLVRPVSEGRYDLHELIRQFAAQKLRENGLEAETHEQHLVTYIRYADSLVKAFGEKSTRESFALLEPEIANCRIALRWALDHHHPQMALQLLTILYLPWLRLGHWQEGERWLREALEAAGDEPSSLVCIGLVGLGTFMAIQGDFAKAFPLKMRAEAMAELLNDPVATMAVAEQAMQAEVELDKARAWFETFVSLLQQWEHPIRNRRLAGAYCLFGDRLRDSGYYSEAETHYHKVLEIDRAMHSIMSMYAVGNLGRLALQRGDIQEAQDRISRVVTQMRAEGNRLGIADWTRALGEVRLHSGDVSAAENSFEEALSLYEEIGNRRASADIAAYLVHVAVLQRHWNAVIERLQWALSLYAEILHNSPSLISGHVSEYIIPFINGLFCGALLMHQREQNECAATIIGYAATLRETNPQRPEPHLAALVGGATESLRQRLGNARYDELLETGQSMSIGEMIDYVLRCIKG